MVFTFTADIDILCPSVLVTNFEFKRIRLMGLVALLSIEIVRCLQVWRRDWRILFTKLMWQCYFECKYYFAFTR
jgi:hypothetical protein